MEIPNRALPKNGAICRQFVKCGRPNCRCARGAPHVAFYLFWRQDGMLKKCYVPRRHAEALRALLASRRALRKAAREEKRAAHARWSELTRMVREAERDATGP